MVGAGLNSLASFVDVELMSGKSVMFVSLKFYVAMVSEFF